MPMEPDTVPFRRLPDTELAWAVPATVPFAVPPTALELAIPETVPLAVPVTLLELAVEYWLSAEK